MKNIKQHLRPLVKEHESTFLVIFFPQTCHLVVSFSDDQQCCHNRIKRVHGLEFGALVKLTVHLKHLP